MADSNPSTLIAAGNGAVTGEMYRALFDRIDQAFAVFEMIYDAEGRPVDFRYVETNAAFEKQAGRRPQPGQTMRELFPEAKEMWLEDYAEVARTGEPKRFVDHQEELDRWFDVFVFPIDGTNGHGQLAALFSDVTERERAAIAVRSSEEKYRRLFETIDEGYLIGEVIFDENNKAFDILFLETNPAAVRLAGRNFKGQRMREIDPDYEEYWFEAYGRVALTGETIHAEHYAAPHGRWFELHLSKVGGPESRRVASVFQDITERKRAEEQLAAQKEYAESIVATLHEPLLVLSPDLTVRTVNAAFYRQFQVNPAETIGRKIYDLGNGQWNIPALRILLEDVLPDSNVFNDYEVTHEFETLGPRVMLVNGRRLDHVQLILLGIRDITERKQREDALRKSEERLRRVLETESVGVIFFNHDGVVIDANDIFLRMTGYSREEVESRKLTWQSLTPLEHFRISELQLKKLQETGHLGPYEKEYLRKDGSRFWILFSGRDLGDGTAAEYAIDISDRKAAETKLRQREEQLEKLNVSLSQRVRELQAAQQNMRESTVATLNVLEDAVAAREALQGEVREREEAEEALRESEEQFRRAIEEAPIPVIMHAEDGTVLQISKSWTELTGYHFEEVPTFDAWLNRAYGEGANEVRTHMRDLFDGSRRSISVEFPVRTRDGRVRYWSFSASSPGTLRDGRRFIVGMAVDITERKEAEQELRESEEWRRLSLRPSNLFVWSVNPETGETRCSENASEVLGFDVPGTVAETMALIYPDDRDAVTETVERALRGESRFELEHRVLHPATGEIIWIRAQGESIESSDGSKRFVGLTQNITRRKEAEQALRQSEERFRLLVEGARDYAMFVLDLDNVITYWSSGAERLFGWSRAEVEGRGGGDIIFTPEDQARGAVEEEIGTALREGRAPDRRWHLRKDGSRLFIDGVMMRLDNEQGEPRAFAKIARDATRQQEDEEALRHARDQLEQRVLERTAELIETNQRLREEATRRAKLENEILEVTERERARISQDLHDSLCQELTATAFLLKSQARAIGKTDPKAAESMREAAETVNANAGLARDLARGLHPPELGAGGIVSALRELASRTNEKVTCRCECPRALRVPDANVAVNLYRIAQEAVLNASKHANASEIVICIEREKKEIVLSIADDGKSKRRAKPTRGLGIHMMQYRASVAGGTLTIERRRPRGTRIVCRVPAKR